MSELTWDWNYVIEIFPDISRALWITLTATITAYALALVLGVVITICRRSSFKPLSHVTYFFTQFIRCTPPLVQLFFVFYALPMIPVVGVTLSPFTAGVLTLGIHYSTYISEVYRSGIESVPKGQWEAGTALNFSKAHIWRKIIVPQSIPPVIPMLGNYFIVMFKETPLLSAITLVEILQMAKIIGSQSFRYLEPITIVGILFLLLSYPSALLVRKLEARMKVMYVKK
jgi:polar amino acid transport system permease protein